MPYVTTIRRLDYPFDPYGAGTESSLSILAGFISTKENFDRDKPWMITLKMVLSGTYSVYLTAKREMDAIELSNPPFIGTPGLC